MQCSGEQSCTALWEVEAAVHFSSWEMFLVIWEGVHSVSASAKSGVPKICKVRQSCQKPTGEQCEHRRRGAVLGFCCLGCWALPCVGLVGVFFETELVWEPFSSFSLRPFISSLKASPFYREVTANVPINSVRVRLGSGVMPAHHHPRGKDKLLLGLFFFFSVCSVSNIALTLKEFNPGFPFCSQHALPIVIHGDEHKDLERWK